MLVQNDDFLLNIRVEEVGEGMKVHSIQYCADSIKIIHSDTNRIGFVAR